jgi:hypothetical protein
MEFPMPYNKNLPSYVDPPVPIPWVKSIPFFEQNPDWAYFLGMNESDRARNSIWFEWV